MTYRIHYTLPDGTEDSIVIRAATIEALQAIAFAEVSKRGGTDWLASKSRTERRDLFESLVLIGALIAVAVLCVLRAKGWL